MAHSKLIERHGMYTVTAENTDKGVILHMQVEGIWSKEMKRSCFYDLARLHLAFGKLQAVVKGYNPKLRKFLGILGFEYKETIENYKGEEFDFYSRPLP